MTIARERLCTEEIERLAAEVADDALRLTNDECACGRVPGMELPFPEPVQAATRDVAEIERRRAVAPYALCASHEVREERDVEIDMLAPVIRKPRGDEGIVERRRRRN